MRNKLENALDCFALTLTLNIYLGTGITDAIRLCFMECMQYVITATG